MAFSSVLQRLQHDRTRSILMAPVTFYDTGDLETNYTCWPCDKIQEDGEYLACKIFSHSNLSAFVQETRGLLSR